MGVYRKFGGYFTFPLKGYYKGTKKVPLGFPKIAYGGVP